MKKITNKENTKKIVILLLIIMIFNFSSPNFVKSDDEYGGELFGPVFRLVAGIGDICLRGMQYIFMGYGEIAVKAETESAEASEEYNITYSPGVIFSNRAPVLDVNFFNYGEDFKYTANVGLEKEGDLISSGAHTGETGEAYKTGKEEVLKSLGYDISSLEELDDDAKKSFVITTAFAGFATNAEVYKTKDNKYIELKLAQFQSGGIVVQGQKYKCVTVEGENKESSAKLLRNTVATWYKALRAFALVGLLSALVYIGIRILISSTGQEKAKYKKMVIDWITAIFILFVLQYVMVFTLTIADKITDVLEVKVIEVDETTGIGTDKLMNKIRTDLKEADVTDIELTKSEILFKTFITMIIYLALVIETGIFSAFYLKRLVYMAFFTMIAPLVALTYPLDKIKDGQAQAFSTLIREYIFNALIQPVHLLLYYILVFSAGNLVDQNPLYAVVAIGFMIPAEKFFRKMFGFEKASSVSQVGAAAGGALIMNAINKMRQGGTGGGSKAIGKGQSGGTSGTPTRTASPTNAVEIGTADDGSTGESGAAGGSGGTPGSLGTTRRANTHGATLARTNSFGNGIKAVRRKYINKNTARTMGRMTRKAAIGGLGGLAAGTVGLAAGVATGDVGNVFKYGAAGAAAGYMGANYAGDKLLAGEKNLRETFKEGAIGQEEYNNLKSDKEFYESDEFRSMLNNPSLMPGEKHRNREMRNAVQVYRDNGITDTGKIAGAMKQGLTAQEGAYAIKLAEMIGRSGWNNPKTREDFEKRYKSNMPSGANADKIWKSIESLL